MTETKVALLGLGTMGKGMALNLLKAGFALTVYNRTPAKAAPLAALGAVVAQTAAEAAHEADVVLSMLADDEAARAAWLGENGALLAMRKNSIAVECSTASPAWVADFGAAAMRQGLRVLEAPVTGSRAQAEGGQLTFLVGGETGTIEAVRPVLDAMGKGVLHLGPLGSGAQMKLVNNFLCGVQVTSFAEALAWIERTGLNRETALEFLKKGAPGSGIFNAMAQRMTERTYDVNFLLRLMAKDLRYAQAAAAEFGVVLNTAEVSEQRFAEAERQGRGEQDMSAVVEVVRASK